jgi:hypothetical protein
MNLPDKLPTLSSGKQSPGSGQVCAEQLRGRDDSGRFVWKSHEERFRARVTTSDGCWSWLGSTTSDGYGCISAFGELRAHRASWVLHHGPIPSGMHVLHRCDNPPCTNPDHLFLGTIADNNRDRNRKGRDVKAFPTRQKVTPEVIARARAMRAEGLIQQDIADALGVSRGRIAHYIGDILPRGTRGVRRGTA